ncbi:MAG: alanine racemase, partial [Planctomycetota bacterium]
EEAIDLRSAGIDKPIILLTAVPSEDVDVILDHDITACIAEEGFARDLSVRALARGTQAAVHINVDTGMHRIGLDWQGAASSILSISRLAGLRIAGIFSHFACSDADDLSFSRLQVQRFRSVLGQLQRAGIELPFIHMANSNGVLRLPEAYFDGVRPGLILYGLRSRADLCPAVDLRPVLSMRTRISHCKRIPKGQKVGYGHTFTTWRDSVIATLPVGYHDGYIRQFSNVGEVLVRGRPAPVVGRVCMDQTLADVTDVPGAELGDEVVIYGEQQGQRLSLEEMAARVQRMPWAGAYGVSLS